MIDWTITMEYLLERSSRHGLDPYDLLNETPESVADCPYETKAYWEGRDISHIKSQHNSPELADDPTNIMAEDPSTNRARGSSDMTDAEIREAAEENLAFAESIDNSYHYDLSETFWLGYGFA